MKKLFFFTLSFLFSFSSAALAAVPAPGDALRNLTTFFTGLVSGSASMENAYFISFILYLIIFIAIYMEGLKQIPIFGARGELNKQGKWFAVAAAGLSTIAIFIVDNVTNVTMAERLSYLVSPWGVWGGVMIAAIMAYITFRFLHDSELFKEHIMFAMAVAAAVGVTLAGFLLTMENLIGWGFLIMLLVFLIGALYAIFGGSGGSGDDGDGGRDGGDVSGDDGTGERRPPGPESPPTVTPPHPTDPKDPPKFVPGLTPGGPKPKAPKLPKKPKIPKAKEIFIDLSPHFNGIRNQDGLGACTAFAATSIFEYILKRGYGFHSKYVSPLYLWYKTRKTIGKVGENTGPWTCMVPMQNLQQEGVCFEELWPFEPHPSEKWKRAPEPLAEADAPTKKILEVHAVDKNDPDQWVYQLAEGNPLNIAINCPAGFSSYNEKLYTNPNPSASGGHAMVIVGYHSHYPHKDRGIKAFKIRNSWGPHWGENGYIWMPAEILKKLLFEDPLVIKGWKKDKQEPKKKEQEKIAPEVIKGLREVEEIAASIRDCAKKKEFIIAGKKRKEWINSLYKLLEKVFDGREFEPDMNKVIELLYGEPQKVLKGYKGKNLRKLCETVGEEKNPEDALKDQENALFLSQEILKAINALKERHYLKGE